MMPRDPDAASPSETRIYPCRHCGKLRTKAEGGTVFTVCDKCWDETMKPSKQLAPSTAP